MRINFKGIIAAGIAAAVILIPCCAFAASVIEINGVMAEIPEEMGQIREADDRTFVPLRFVSEFLNNEVWYIDDFKTACVNSQSEVILVQDGNSVLFKTVTDSGEQTEITMDTAAYIDTAENRMYLPIRYLAEAIGYTVGWDETTQTVTLDKN